MVIYFDQCQGILFWSIMNKSWNNLSKTSVHSSRMRTARLLAIYPNMHCTGGVCFWGGVPASVHAGIADPPDEQNDWQTGVKT